MCQYHTISNTLKGLKSKNALFDLISSSVCVTSLSGLLNCVWPLLVPSTAAVLTIDVHSWQHHRHLGSTSFVVAGGGKQQMIL